MFFNHFRKILKENISRKITIVEEPIHQIHETKTEKTDNENTKDQRGSFKKLVHDETTFKEPDIDPIIKAMKEVDLTLEPDIKPSYYYYKRWLWITFPWICLQPDRRYNFSALIRECYSSNMKYISVSDDMLLTECKM